MTIFTSAIICIFNKIYLGKFVNKIIAFFLIFFQLIKIKSYAKFSTKTKAQVHFAER